MTTELHDLTKKLVDGEDKTRKCDHCGYELANEGVMYFYPDEGPVWCSFECAIHADKEAV